MVKKAEEKHIPTPEEIQAELIKEMRELKKLVKEQQTQLEVLYGGEDIETVPEEQHICEKCPALSMGVFDETQQEEFQKLKTQYPLTKGKRPQRHIVKVRELFIDSIRCNADRGCPYSDDEPIEAYKKFRTIKEYHSLKKVAQSDKIRFPQLRGI